VNEAIIWFDVVLQAASGYWYTLCYNVGNTNIILVLVYSPGDTSIYLCAGEITVVLDCIQFIHQLTVIVACSVVVEYIGWFLCTLHASLAIIVCSYLIA